MDAFVTRKKRKSGHDVETPGHEENEDSTDLKLAKLSSLHPRLDQEALLDILLAHDGSVEDAAASLRAPGPAKKPSGVAGAQSSLRLYASGPAQRAGSASPRKKGKLLSKKGATLHLFDPEDISEHTPCTVIHNFLPADLANELLGEMLEQSKTFEKITFKLFDTVVSSPHTSSFFVGSTFDVDRQKYDYIYNGARLTDVRTLTPHLEAVKPLVTDAVNEEIQKRIKTRYPGGTKLRFQSPRPWTPNAAFVNCYDGPQQSVGWHSDQLTYLGPRPVIGSLSLGVAREFRVRRVVARDAAAAEEEGGGASADGRPDPEDPAAAAAAATGDVAGQIAIHLPHNSLLVMHAEMQEQWKHSIAPAQAIDPHPVAGNRRINITYRDYRDEFHPRHTPKCKCAVPSILRVVQRKKDNWGRYFWMCHAGNVPEKEGCSFFQWAEFDDDGNPLQASAGKRRVASIEEQR